MAKLTAKEMFMVIILVNVVVYFLGYTIIVKPLLSLRTNTVASFQEAKAENERIKKELADNELYVKNITEAENKRTEYYEQSYPFAREEIIHQFMSEKLKAHQLVMQSIKVTEEKDKKKNNNADTDVEIDSVFKSYMIEISCTGPYKNTKEFLADIENLKKTAAVTNLNIGTSKEGTQTSITFNMVTVNKGDQNEKDKTFNFTAPNAQGGGYNDLRIS